MESRYRINLGGRVQAVGLRPTVYCYARENNLGGWISNTPEGAIIEVEGEKREINAFLKRLQSSPPPQAQINIVKIQTLPLKKEQDFKILASIVDSQIKAQICPDLATCDQCLKELLDRHNRRFLYPFINCTNCGPRLTIITGLPYDRQRTTMKKFTMCSLCSQEYKDPLNRRFHAQPNACPRCGPQVSLLSSRPASRDREKNSPSCPEISSPSLIKKTVKLLKAGKVVAIKGLGGFHLAVDAFNQKAVKNLRKRKYREDKPFALMAKDIRTIRQFCEVSGQEERMLARVQRPIVILQKRQQANKSPSISEEVAPNNKYLGFMLPYTPLHYLLFDFPGLKKNELPSVLVMTSANLSDEPIAYENEEALSRLAHIADYFLLHNRDIYLRSDDSVIRLLPFTKTELIIRRSRGYAPAPISLPFSFKKEILACGAHSKNTFCLARDKEIFLSHHIGDLENYETFSAFQKGIEHYKNTLAIQPRIIACDLHPEYLSTKYAREYVLRHPSCSLIKVQHHHSHIASCLADNAVPKNSGAVIGVVFDGIGFGEDGNIWGGEFIIADYKHYERRAHLKYIPLPGGEQATRQPWRMAFSYLYQTYGEEFPSLNPKFLSSCLKDKWPILKRMIAQGINSPLTSSVGRLFDAVASLVGLRDEINYEGQAAVELEQVIDKKGRGKARKRNYSYKIEKKDGIYIIDPAPLIKGIVQDLDKSVPCGMIAAKFHHALAGIIVDVCVKLREDRGLDEVALSGGVFQNIFLTGLAFKGLTARGFKVYLHQRVPPNDGGICLGQAVIANEKVKKEIKNRTF